MSEEFSGKALSNNRNNIVLATKVRGKRDPATTILAFLENTLSIHAMQVSRGLAQISSTSIRFTVMIRVLSLEETLRALDDLVRQGKVRYIGVSNFTGWQLMKALAISEKQNLERFVTLQALYSLIARDLENEQVPLSLDQNLGFSPGVP